MTRADIHCFQPCKVPSTPNMDEDGDRVKSTIGKEVSGVGGEGGGGGGGPPQKSTRAPNVHAVALFLTLLILPPFPWCLCPCLYILNPLPYSRPTEQFHPIALKAACRDERDAHLHLVMSLQFFSSIRQMMQQPHRSYQSKTLIGKLKTTSDNLAYK